MRTAQYYILIYRFVFRNYGFKMQLSKIFVCLSIFKYVLD